MSSPEQPRPADVGREEMTTTKLEKFLAFLLSIAWLAGVAWGIAEVRRRWRASAGAGSRPGARI